MKKSKIEAKNKIAIKGDRNEPIIAAIQDIYINRPELYKELTCDRRTLVTLVVS